VRAQFDDLEDSVAVVIIGFRTPDLCLVKFRRTVVPVCLGLFGLLAIIAGLFQGNPGKDASQEALSRITSSRIAEVSNVLSSHLGTPTVPTAMPSTVRYLLSSLLDSNSRIAYLDEVTDGLCIVIPHSNSTNAPFLIHLTNGH
jgi:hypothetical protein